MCYVGAPFRHDLFVSYSHGDVAGDGDSPLKRWSQAFAVELERELRMNPKIGNALKLFIDNHRQLNQSLDPLAPVADQLRAEIGSAALLVVLMSPHYLGSNWCTREREWWCQQQQQQQLGLTHNERIAIARIWPSSDPWPAPLMDANGDQLVGFWFHDRSRADSRPQPYEWPEPTSSSKGPFRDALLDLVAWLWRKLDDMKACAEASERSKQEAATLASDTGQVVYLHARAEDAKRWDEARQTLSDSGMTVFPTDPEEVTSDALKMQESRRRRVETLGGCDALLLLANEDGRALDADLVIVGKHDRQSARALAQRLLPCGLLDTIGEKIATPRRKQNARALQVDWIDSTRDPWTDKVQRWLTEKSLTVEQVK